MTVLETQSTPVTVRYLVVDDHEPFRRMVEEYLAGPDCEIFACSNGREAVEHYPALLPHWVIMDIEMPEMDGLEATRLIRARFPEARIVILTQHESPEIRQASLAAGASYFLPKENLGDLDSLLQAPPTDPSPPLHS